MWFISGKMGTFSVCGITVIKTDGRKHWSEFKCGVKAVQWMAAWISLRNILILTAKSVWGVQQRQWRAPPPKDMFLLYLLPRYTLKDILNASECA